MVYFTSNDPTPQNTYIDILDTEKTQQLVMLNTY